SLFHTVQSGERGDVHKQLLHVEAGLNKRLAQAVQNVRTISQHRLFYNLIEQLLDEGVLGLFTAGGELRQVARARQPDRFAVVRRVIAHRVNRPVSVAGAKPPRSEEHTSELQSP